MDYTILFDIDGTLMDSTEAINIGFQEAFIKAGFTPPNFDDINSLVGYPLHIMFKELGVDESLIDKFIQNYGDVYKEICTQKTKLIDETMQALKIASSLANLGVVTTKNSASTKYLLKHFGLIDYFKVVIGKNDVIEPKPSPEPILKALLHLDKPNKKAFMIGDTKLDLISANSAGVIGMGVTCGYGKLDELLKYSEFVFKNPFEAVNYIVKNF